LKKPSQHRLERAILFQKRRWARQRAWARQRRGRRLHCMARFLSFRLVRLSTPDEARRARSAWWRSAVSRFDYLGPPSHVQLEGNIGTEEDALAYCSTMERTIDVNARSLDIRMTDVTYAWPSFVMGLCAFAVWTEAVSRAAHCARMKVSSTFSRDPIVSDFLIESGFGSFVGIKNNQKSRSHKKHKFSVRIRHEKDRSSERERRTEVYELIDMFANLSERAKEVLRDRVITEIFHNVTEHGTQVVDAGYWVLAQYHPSHGLISVSVADNGIGFRGTLATGVYGKQLVDRVPDTPLNDDRYIALAVDENMTGSLRAKGEAYAGRGTALQFLKGARRGQGMGVIVNESVGLGITVTIISHYGLFRRTPTGETLSRSFRQRAFPGTLYHLTIPAIRIEGEL
jgi:predicted secreted protein